MAGRVLIVDDDDAFARTLGRALEHEGYDVLAAATGEDARAILPQESVDVVILDYQLPDANGLELLSELPAVTPSAVFIMATAYPDWELSFQASKLGAFQFIAKDGEVSEYLARVESAYELASLRRAMLESAPREGMIGKSRRMRELAANLEKLEAAPDVTVLLLGETGVGKGLVARAIHAASARAVEPFVAVDCTTIPEKLVESELFGAEKGAYTDATATKVGKVEAARRGTLFLDELGELPLEVQAKLLRLLEEREFTRVGGTKVRELGARVVAATNRDLEQAVAERRFRADLYYRLDAFRLEVPPLRDRGDDCLLLSQHFLTQHARSQGRGVPTLDDTVMDAMRRYGFPGNVRELRNMVERALLHGKGDRLSLEHFPDLYRAPATSKHRSVPRARRTPDPLDGTFGPARRTTELPRVTRVVAEPQNIGAPEILGRVTWDDRPAADPATASHLPVSARPFSAYAEGAADAPRGGAPVNPQSVPSPDATQVASAPHAPTSLRDIREAQARRERAEIVAALQQTGGNVTKAASVLKWDRSKLNRRLVKYGLK